MSKKLVNSDFKNNRVEDPTRISSKQEKNVKKYVKDYFDKAVAKKRDHDKKRAERKAKPEGPRDSPAAVMETPLKKDDESDGEEIMVMSDDDDVKENVKEEPKSITPMTPMDQIINGDGLKRKREAEHGLNGVKMEDEEATPSKRPRSLTPPVPPPPPPPAEGMPEDDSTMDDFGEYNGETPQEESPSGVYSQGTVNDVTAIIEEQIDVIHPPPPPPPLFPTRSPVNDLSYDIDHQQTDDIIGHFEFAKTPDGREDMSDEPDDGFVTIHRDQARYLEAQGGA